MVGRRGDAPRPHPDGRPQDGQLHKVALPYWVDKDGHRIVVASFAGADKNPSWFVNLADKKANPQILVRVQRATYWSEAEVLDGDDYTETWAGLTADRAYYNDYQTRCTRRIPLVRLPETNWWRPATDGGPGPGPATGRGRPGCRAPLGPVRGRSCPGHALDPQGTSRPGPAHPGAGPDRFRHPRRRNRRASGRASPLAAAGVGLGGGRSWTRERR
ncbi:nitroreductase/quinone reductase family protein [Yinghuangia aomiensis]